MKRVKNYLLTGFLVLAPMGVSLTLLVWAVSFLDRLLAPLVATVLGHTLPGLGVIAALALLLAAGFFSSNIVGHHLVGLAEELMLRIPVLNWFYRAFKQLADVFSPQGESKFQRVVLVEYPRAGCYRLAFVTGRVALDDAARARDLVAVFIPTNHLYIGDVALLPREAVVDTGMSVQQGVQAVFSAGASFPSSLPLPPKKTG